MPTAPVSYARNYARITGIGEKANVASVLEGWTASAVKGRIAVKGQVFRGKSNRTTALTVLKAVVRQI